ncbi:MAG: hypothetical protein LBP73_07360 [Clostridiales Family XIII bacterium]|jgi:hypothetical protein|nr:hypothetical protein [Clostridiales Family XIII bacterium]
MESSTRRTLLASASALALCFALAPALCAPAFAADFFHNIVKDALVVEDGSSANTVRALDGNGIVLLDNIDPSVDRIVVSGSTNKNRIEVKTTRFVEIELRKVSIDVSANKDACAFSLIPGANVRLIVNGSGINLLRSGALRAGIEVPAGAAGPSSGASLEIRDINHPKSTSDLTAISASHGAGIGGADGKSAGSVLVRSARVRAFSGGFGAGIGGGFGGAGGLFFMDGGDVEAGSDNDKEKYAFRAGIGQGAGIGGGYNGPGGTVVVVSRAPDGYPKLCAYSSLNNEGEGAGIGGGANANGGIVAINCHDNLKDNGGGVKAYGSVNGVGRGAGIGGGFRGAGGTVVVTDCEGSDVDARSSGALRTPPNVIASSQGYGANIGAGYGNGSHGNQLLLTHAAAGDRVVGNVVLPDTILQYNLGKADLPVRPPNASVLDYRIAPSDKLIVPMGSSLRISVNTTLINKGEIENYGTIYNDWRFDNSSGTIRNQAVIYTGGQFIPDYTSGQLTPGVYVGPLPIRSSSTAPSVSAPVNPAWPAAPRASYAQLPAANRNAWVEYSLSGTTATLRLTQGKTAEIIEASSDGTADIDLSELDGVTEAAFPRQALIDFADRGLDVEFRMPRGVVRLSRAAARDIAGQGNNTQAYLRFRPLNPQSLNAALRGALREGDAVYELTMTIGGQNVRSFSGEVSVTIPYAGGLPAGAWSVDENGRRRGVTCSHESGSLRLTLRFFSVFAVGRDEASATSGNTPWYYVR